MFCILTNFVNAYAIQIVKVATIMLPLKAERLYIYYIIYMIALIQRITKLTTQSTFSIKITLGGNVLFPLRITLSVKCIGVQQDNIITVQPTH